MTNLEKFREVFGFTPTPYCIGNEKFCDERNRKEGTAEVGIFYDPCEDCPFHDWWNKEYKPCFRIKEEFEE